MKRRTLELEKKKKKDQRKKTAVMADVGSNGSTLRKAKRSPCRQIYSFKSHI